MRHLFVATILICAALASAAQAAEPEAVGIALEGYAYPHPVAYLPLTLQGEPLRMGYMDVAPTGPANGRSVLLMHGRNFPASYWEPVILALTGAGYRVVAPDQIGFGKSSKPGFVQSFDDMARSTAALLDHLGIAKADVIAHSMGGMLGVRFTRTYANRVDHLVLEGPLGLEDYRFAVPPVETERLMETERKLTADGYRKQLVASYAPTAESEIEPYVELRERIRQSGEYERWLRAFANSYQTIYHEPVVHEIPLIRNPTLFVIGARDHNAPGRPLAPAELRAGMGHNAEHAKELAAAMPNGRAVIFEEAGHMVHFDATQRFDDEVLRFLASP